jgi:hypothetical protein
MPYFKNENTNLLFIHIPKTGGCSLEKYFANMFNITLNNTALYNWLPYDIKLKNNINVQTSLQHLTYQDIMKYKSFLNIDLCNLKMITIVRNPYNKILSDLFFLTKINIYSTKEDVFSKIQMYLTKTNSGIDNIDNIDNHNTPQYLFLIDENNELIHNIHILRTETLNDDMHRLGYEDFDIKINKNPNKINYDDYLNEDSINLINKYYDEDFKLFNYTKK